MLHYPITITIDTNIFDSVKYDLSDGSKLQILSKHVKDGKVKIVLSDIVLNESKAHLKRLMENIYSEIRKNRTDLLKLTSEYMINSVGLKAFIVMPDKESVIENASMRFSDYLNSMNVEMLGVSNVDVTEIVDDYFNVRPPFENGEKKRKEFPDAFIVNQIKKRFPNQDSVIIISNDKGFLRGCLRYNNYKTMNSLDELFEKISEQDERYSQVIDQLEILKEEINSAISNYLLRTESISVAGLSYDNSGIVYGHEYSETFLKSINNVSHKLHIIDDIDVENALITLSCMADIEMDCYYEDYDNAVWDSEEKKYLYLRTVHLLEKHRANFACRIRINLKSNNGVELLPLHVYLGGNSRKYTKVIDEEQD